MRSASLRGSADASHGSLNEWSVPIGGLRVRGPTAKELLDGMGAEDRESATIVHHRGGSVIVCLNRYEKGHSLKKRPLPRNPITRWLLTRGYLPATWSVQAEYRSACMGTNGFTRGAAIRDGVRWIDEQAASASERRGEAETINQQEPS